MNSLAQTEPSSNSAAVMAPIVSIAYMLGASDGEAGEYCLPEKYFVRREYILKYVEGHEDVAGETRLSKQAKEMYGDK